MMDIYDSIGLQTREYHSPHGLFGIIGSSISQGASWANALTDWLLRKPITISGAEKTPTLNEDFSSDSWAETGTKNQVSGGNLIWDGDRDGTVHGCTYDLTSVSDTAWTLRFKLQVNNVANPSSGVHSLSIGIGDQLHSVGGGSNHDAIDMTLRRELGGASEIQFRGRNGVDLFSTEGTVLSHTLAAETLYIEIKRESVDRARITLFADSEYTEVIETLLDSTNVSSSITSLRYIHVKGYDLSSSSGGSLDGIIDDLKFWNNETVPQNIPSQQTATRDDDFTESGATSHTSSPSTVGGWLAQDHSVIKVNGTNDNVDFDPQRDGSNNTMTYDLGSALNNERFVFDAKVRFSELTTGNSCFLYIGMSSVSSATAQSGNGDTILADFRFDGVSNGLEASDSDGSSMQPVADKNSAFTWLINTDYFLRIRRLSATSYVIEVFSDSDRKNLLVYANGTCASTLQGLQYIRISDIHLTSVSGSMVGTIDDIKVYDNITELNPSTLDDYAIPVKITGDTDLQRKTAETLEELFTADSWVDQDSAKVGVTVGEGLVFSTKRDGTNDSSSLDLGSALSNTKWRMDWDLEYTTITQGDANEVIYGFTISDSPSTTAHQTNQDALGILHDVSSIQNDIHVVARDGTDIGSHGTASSTNFTFSPTTQKYFMTFIRSSSTSFTVKVFLDRSRTLLLEQKQITIASTIIGLRYIKWSNFNIPSGTSTIDGKITNVRVWDAITNPVTQETATETDDFTSDNYTDVGSNMTVTGGAITSASAACNGDNRCWKLLNQTLDDKNWCVQFKFNHTASSGAWVHYPFVFTSTQAGINPASYDQLGMVFESSASNPVLKLMKTDGTTLNHSGTEYIISTSTDYYIRISRINITTLRLEIFTDSGFSVLVHTQDYTVDSTIVDLDTVQHGTRTNLTAVTADWTIDDMEIWSGISKPDASGRKIVFTDNQFDASAVEYSSETVSYDPINGDYFGYIRVPSLPTGADTILQMYYDYTPSVNPNYTPEPMPQTSETPEYDFGFGSDTWSDVGTEIAISGGVLNWTSERDDDASAIDLANAIGEALKDTWTLDFDLTFSTVTAPITSSQNLFYFGIFDESEASRGNNAQSGIYLVVTGISTATPTVDWGVGTTTATTLSLSGDAASTDIGTAPTTTTFYCRLIRESLTTVRLIVYSDSSYSTELYNVSMASTVTATLQYLKGCQYSYSIDTGTIDGTIDNVKFYNGKILHSREQSTWNPDFKTVHHLNGNTFDSTVYGNDGTETAIDYEEQNNNVGAEFDGSTSKIDFGSDTSIDNVFDQGGKVSVIFNPRSDGESNIGRIISKQTSGNTGWWLDTTSESGGLVRLTFNHTFSGTNAGWQTDVIVAINELHHVEIIYNSDDVNNDPILILDGIRLTLGSGLTLITRGTGTRSSDDTVTFVAGNLSAQTSTFDGFIDETRLVSTIKSSLEAITNYNAEKENTDFITVGTEETQ